MEKSLPLLVFSDLDGTLLDHETYDWSPAVPALSTLKNIGAGVVLASSKTAAEMHVIQKEMGLDAWPAIVENGAGLLQEDGDGAQYALLRDAIESAPHRKGFVGFGDMTVAEISHVTGLSAQAAKAAKTRQHSEPGLWKGTEAGKVLFLSGLADKGVTAREGGRFLTLSFGKTKADQMAEITAQMKPKSTLALGDAPNDVEMLQTADHGVIIANPHRPALATLPEESTGRITRTVDAGPSGWNAAVLTHLKTRNLLKTDLAHG